LPLLSPSGRDRLQALLRDIRHLDEADLFSIDEARLDLAKRIAETPNALWSCGFATHSQTSHARLLQLSDSYDQLQSARSTPALAAAWPPEVRADMEALTHGLLHFLNQHEQHTENALDVQIAAITKRLEQNGLQSVIAPPAIRPRELSIPPKPVIHPIYFQGDPNPSPEVLRMIAQVSEEARLAVAAIPLAKALVPDTLVAEIMVKFEEFEKGGMNDKGTFAIWNDRGTPRSTFYEVEFENISDFWSYFKESKRPPPPGEIYFIFGLSLTLETFKREFPQCNFEGSQRDALFLYVCGNLIIAYQFMTGSSGMSVATFFETHRKITCGNHLEASDTYLATISALFNCRRVFHDSAITILKQRIDLKEYREAAQQYLRPSVRLEKGSKQGRESLSYLMAFPHLYNECDPIMRLKLLRSVAGITPLPLSLIDSEQHWSIQVLLAAALAPLAPATKLSTALDNAHILNNGETTYLLLDESEIAALKQLRPGKRRRILEDVSRTPVMIQGDTAENGLTPLSDTHGTLQDTWYHTLVERLKALIADDPLCANELERLYHQRTEPEIAPLWTNAIGLVMHHDNLEDLKRHFHFLIYNYFADGSL